MGGSEVTDAAITADSPGKVVALARLIEFAAAIETVGAEIVLSMDEVGTPAASAVLTVQVGCSADDAAQLLIP